MLPATRGSVMAATRRAASGLRGSFGSAPPPLSRSATGSFVVTALHGNPSGPGGANAPRSLWILGEARIPKRETRRDIHAHGGNKRGESSMAGAGGGGSSGGSGYGGSGGGGGGGGAGGGGEAAGLAAIWAAYLKLCETKPVLTKSITSAFLNGFGDVMSQIFIEGDHPFDWQRLFKFTSIGLILVGPTLHFWYLSLSKIVTLQGTAGAALRLALDQLAFAPAFIVAFFSTLCCFEGNPDKIAPMLKQEWWPAVVTNWKIWVPFQFLNFRLVPQQLQVLTANIIALAWNTYLSFASHREIEDPQTEPTTGKGNK